MQNVVFVQPKGGFIRKGRIWPWQLITSSDTSFFICHFSYFQIWYFELLTKLTYISWKNWKFFIKIQLHATCRGCHTQRLCFPLFHKILACLKDKSFICEFKEHAAHYDIASPVPFTIYRVATLKWDKFQIWLLIKNPQFFPNIMKLDQYYHLLRR